MHCGFLKFILEGTFTWKNLEDLRPVVDKTSAVWAAGSEL